MARRKKEISRDDELSGREELRDKLLKVREAVSKGFSDQRERSDNIIDYWDAYNCKLGPRQFYSGRSEIFVPIIRDAIRARKTRFVNQIFPNSQRYVEALSHEPDHPLALLSLIEHYVRSARLRTQVMPALIVNGDVEGQYSIYVDWRKVERHVVTRSREPVKVHGMEFPDLGEIETVAEEEIEDSDPGVEVIHDADLLVLPATVDRIEDAIQQGGSVTIIRRWSKSVIDAKIADGSITEADGDDLKESMSKIDDEQSKPTAKSLADDAGIKVHSGKSYAQVYETWTRIKIDDEKRLVRVFFGGDEVILGCRLCPNWNDRVPVFSAPVEKVAGVFKGKSQVEGGVLDMQIAANDAVNQGQDSLAFSLAPLMSVDPEKVSRWQELVLDVGAVWPVPPDGMKAIQFPMLTQHAYEVVAAAERRIFQSLGVSPAMIPQSTGTKAAKRNQAEIALEQQVDILTTSEVVTNLEGEILTPLVTMFMELDHQYREHDITVQSYGEMGLKAELEQIPPIQVNKRFEIRWSGVEAARNAAQVQQGIAALNVVRGIPPDQYQGFKLNIAPALQQLMESTFGARLGRQIFQSTRDQLSIAIEQEQELIAQGFDLLVHTEDDDPKHLQAHAQLPPSPNRDAHMRRHMMQMQAKQIAQMAQQMQGQQGVPGGAGPGVAGTPRPGSQPTMPRQNRGPAGMIRPDNMGRAGAITMPRKM